MRGVFQGAGQNCIGIERFLVPSDLHDQFVSMMEERIRSLRVGSVLNGEGSVVDVGAMISDARFGELERRVKGAESEGAEVVVGGEVLRHPYLEHGAYVCCGL